MPSQPGVSKLTIAFGAFVVVAIVIMAVVALSGGEKEQTPAAEKTSYPGEPVTGEPVTTASGLKYYDLEVGTGRPVPGRSATVKVHYTGWLTNGEQFDSSRDGNSEPAEFSLMDVVEGWREGISTMKVGGKRKLIVPPKLGYGDSGSPPKIPPRATLVFDVELIDIVD